ncbi:MAG: LPXTG cell wall anchor domain-containing protein [Clostridiales bacterium]|nr:LPXTG cell wall anchor domain-containing protein [Clostridiales bacterium]
MKQKLKRLAALGLALSMCLSLLSANAWATEVSILWVALAGIALLAMAVILLTRRRSGREK